MMCFWLPMGDSISDNYTKATGNQLGTVELLEKIGFV